MVLVYDNTFEGFLSVVFECYSRKLEPTNICPAKHLQQTMFTLKEHIVTDTTYAERVWKGLQKKMDFESCQLPYKAFLSGDEGIELALYRFIQLVFELPIPIEENYGDPNVLIVRKAARKVMKEAMRMIELIRFQRTRDDIYFAPISPDYDVLPMILKHFKSRFTDQQWLIYDLKRDYGFFYNLRAVEEVVLNEKNFHANNGQIFPNMLQDGEQAYQTMWSSYCQNLTIRERLNLKLQKQHMPKRYWKFLPEKMAMRK